MTTRNPPGPHRPSAVSWPRWLVVGFISGFVSVLIFHQGAAELLHAIGLTARAPYSLHATAPFGIPQVWSLAFWGGVWGVILAAVFSRAEGERLIIGATIFVNAAWGLGVGIGLALFGARHADPMPA